MMLCVDTSAYSFFLRGHPEIIELMETATQLSVSAVVIGELLAGFKGGSHARANEERLDRFLATDGVRVLPVDATTAGRFADISTYLRRQGTALPTNDIWIAAHAMQHGLQVLTLDRHFSRMPQVSVVLVEA